MRISRDCFANFVADFRTTFVRVSRECRENFLVSRTGREVFQHVEKFYANFFSKIFRKTVARLSCDGRELVAAKFWRIYNAKFWRHSYECRASVARRSRDSLAKTSRLSGEKIKLSDIRTIVARHIFKITPKFANLSHKCLFNETAT